jgi:hypothetical protein
MIRHGPMRRRDVAALVLTAIAVAVPGRGEDALYEALLGPSLGVEADVLLSAPGPYVGRAVLTRGRLEGDLKSAPSSSSPLRAGFLCGWSPKPRAWSSLAAPPGSDGR